MKAISIIVPVYNCERFLEESLNSFLAQDMDDYEILLVDDGSSDSSGAICDSYAERFDRVRVIHRENSGPGGARNAGMDATDSKYIMFCDSDDLLVENSLSKVYRLAEENGLDILNFSLKTFPDDRDAGGRWIFKNAITANTYRVMNGVDCLNATVPIKEYYPVVHCKLFRRSLIESIGLRFTTGVMHEDEAFSFIAELKAERIMLIDDQMYLYRMHPGSIMHSKGMKARVTGMKNAIERIAGVLDEPGDGRESMPETEAVIRSINRLGRNCTVQYMMSDRSIRRDCRKEICDLIDRKAPYYRLLDLKTKLYTRNPYLFAYPYRLYIGLKGFVSRG